MSEHTQTPTLAWFQRQDIATQTAMVRDVVELVRIVASSVMAEEVTELAGEPYSRQKPHAGQYMRHGTNPGSIQVGEQRVPIPVPRVRDAVNGECRSLESYQELHATIDPGEGLLRAIALGVGTRNYKDVMETAADAFGVSKSRISASFVERSGVAYKEFRERTLEGEPIVAMIIDGKTFASEQIIVVLGITRLGDPMVLDMIQATSENARAIGDMLRRLLRRGMRTTKGMLLWCVMAARVSTLPSNACSVIAR